MKFVSELPGSFEALDGFHYAAPVKMPYVNLLKHERSCNPMI